jgi:small subunit ribosomal protein S20
MANTKSARKRAEKSEQQRAANRQARSRMRTAVKKARQALDAGSADAAQAVAEAISVVDSSAGKGMVHRNTAARTKSRLAAAARKAAK